MKLITSKRNPKGNPELESEHPPQAAGSGHSVNNLVEERGRALILGDRSREFRLKVAMAKH